MTPFPYLKLTLLWALEVTPSPQFGVIKVSRGYWKIFLLCAGHTRETCKKFRNQSICLCLLVFGCYSKCSPGIKVANADNELCPPDTATLVPDVAAACVGVSWKTEQKRQKPLCGREARREIRVSHLERVKDRLDKDRLHWVTYCRADTGSPLLNVTLCHCLWEA